MQDHLQWHQANWRLRVIVPDRLVEVVGKRFLLSETGETDRDKARRLSATKLKEFRRIIDKAEGKSSGRVHLRHSQRSTYSDEWWTPERLFRDYFPGLVFDLDPCAPVGGSWVPCRHYYTRADDGLVQDWGGRFVWCNPPYGVKHGNMLKWFEKFIANANGILMTSNNSYIGWWQEMARACDCCLLVKGYVLCVNPNRAKKTAPSFGTALFGLGPLAIAALQRAADNGLGHFVIQSRAALASVAG
jgi:hypothetical protein